MIFSERIKFIALRTQQPSFVNEEELNSRGVFHREGSCTLPYKTDTRSKRRNSAILAKPSQKILQELPRFAAE